MLEHTKLKHVDWDAMDFGDGTSLGLNKYNDNDILTGELRDHAVDAYKRRIHKEVPENKIVTVKISEWPELAHSSSYYFETYTVQRDMDTLLWEQANWDE